MNTIGLGGCATLPPSSRGSWPWNFGTAAIRSTGWPRPVHERIIRPMKQIRISPFAARCGLTLAAMLLAGAAAQAQVAPIRYWVPGGPFGFGGGAIENWRSLNWSDVPGFTAETDENGELRSGFVARSYSAPVTPLAGGLGWRAPGGAGAFGNFGSLAAEGSQYGYRFKGVGDMPVTLFGGVDSLKYKPDVFTTLTSPGFASSTTAATSVNAGIEIKPTSNVSLSFSAGYTQYNGTTDSDIRSNLLPGESPMFSGGRR
ncbi:hypothetical protein BJ123_10516 [Rhodopseudomonas thermotolerans]|uniref:Uncharacterized protein n=3 Tax=Nitrobacteraceae TaxID=41294 RepID=A0A336JMC4_9BRAD|nr:hypothetical protein BJ125_10516 [Rhodopseudomonas pentothenatexigens]REG05131.1 hypothetical protein BJ123_10516 [Rhodopseudomonas thermotolerans]SSW89963.1 hypothetical protein SAMN05892882_10516 [Rhodopseudomonas pentothenatexigens]